MLHFGGDAFQIKFEQEAAQPRLNAIKQELAESVEPSDN